MKKLLILLLFFACNIQAQIQPFAFGGSGVWALDFDGSTEYLSCTPALRLTGEYSLVDNFSDGDYNGWTVSSGAYSVVDSVPLSGGTKSLKCTTAGIISIPCNQAYGSWEFDWYKGADANFHKVYFIDDQSTHPDATGSYKIQMSSTEYVGLFKDDAVGASSFYSATSYVLNNTWYRCKVTRNTNGQFYVYIKGGAFGSDYILVSVTGGSGTNPVTDNTYTSSNYFVLDLDANDMIANIVCQQGEGSLDLNSYERIYHSNNRAFEDTTGFRWATNGTHSIVRNTDGVASTTWTGNFSAGVDGVTNGYQTTITGNLDAISDGTTSYDNTLGIVVNGNAAGVSRCYKTLTITSGKTYKVDIVWRAITAQSFRMYYGDLGQSLGTLSPQSTWTTTSVTATATASYTTFVFALVGTPVIGDSLHIASITVKELESRTGYSGKVISTGAGDSTTNYISLPAVNFDTLKTDANGIYEKYTLEGWARGTGIVSATDIISGWNFTSGWTPINTTIDSATAFTVTTTGGWISKSLLTTGKTYKLTIAGTKATGELRVWDGASGIYKTITNNNFNETVYFSATSIYIFLRYMTTGQVIITSLTIQEITQPSITLKIGNQVKTVTGISCVPATFTKFVFNFQSNALVSNQPILLYLNQADTVYIDDVSLTKSYDVLINTFAKHTASSTDWLYSKGSNAVGYAGYTQYITSSNAYIGTLNDIVTAKVFGNTATINNTNYYLNNYLANRIDSATIYINGVYTSKSIITSNGNPNRSDALFYIATFAGSSGDCFAGQIGHLQLTKFTDISQSNVNSTTLTTAYNRGKLIQGEWTGGSPVEVAFYDWKGADATEMLRDKSGAGNNLTGTNIDLNDRVKVKSKFK